MKKISAFEFALMEIADPEKAKECISFTNEEELEIRKQKLTEKVKRLKPLPTPPRVDEKGGEG